jgi:2,3-bisphosphoglycerate-independent phosphoglycerate mutase
MAKKPVMLCIMDGFGWTPDETYGNAVVAANKPHLDALMKNYPMTTINASGMAVGLPDGQMGNSEVGHTNMGAGRIVYQQLTLITKSIKDGEMFKNPVLVKNMKAAIDAGKAIHLMGLVGTGGVHSHADHWFGVLEMAKHMGATKVYLHCIMDGRDTDPHSGKGFLADLQAKLDELGIGTIASVSGRYYAMDRDNNWDREEKAYAAFVYGEGNHAANAQEAIEASYADGKTDEFVIPAVTCEGGRVEDGDTIIFMNFRPDRARQMTRIFCDDAFTGFERRGGRKQVHYVCMAEYDATMPNCEVAYPPVELSNVLGEYLSKNGKTQLRIAETQKYAHVTFFFNGGVEKPNEGEDRVLIPSSKVATFDLKPEMSAYEVTEKAVECINEKKYDVMILNFANCDMVGHTGVMKAAEKAVETVDICVDKVVSAILANGGRAFVTADHGNADQMIDPKTGEPFTAHTTNPVPFIAVDPEMIGRKLRTGGRLADIAPTMLESMGMAIPAEMTGKSLLEK